MCLLIRFINCESLVKIWAYAVQFYMIRNRAVFPAAKEINAENQKSNIGLLES